MPHGLSVLDFDSTCRIPATRHVNFESLSLGNRVLVHALFTPFKVSASHAFSSPIQLWLRASIPKWRPQVEARQPDLAIPSAISHRIWFINSSRYSPRTEWLHRPSCRAQLQLQLIVPLASSRECLQRDTLLRMLQLHVSFLEQVVILSGLISLLRAKIVILDWPF